MSIVLPGSGRIRLPSFSDPNDGLTGTLLHSATGWPEPFRQQGVAEATGSL